MRRASVTIPDELERALEEYRADQDIPPALAAIVQVALQEYLADRGYMAPLPERRRSGRKPRGVARGRRARIEGPDNVGSAVLEDRR